MIRSRAPLALPVLVVCVLSLLASPALAWNHTGHRMVGLIAYQNLDPAAREAVDRILRAHPYYKDDLLQAMPEGFDRQSQWAFMTANTWPDMIRSQAHPMNRTQHHPEWHYIDYAFVQPGTDPATLTGTATGVMTWQPGTAPTNAVQAILKLRADLRDPNLPDRDKAMALCWYLHLVGDIHQPLHATSRFSATWPKGDRGGNDVFFTVANEPINLHAYWDQRIGTYDEPAVFDKEIAAILGKWSRDALKAEIANDDPAKWADASHELGVTVGYLNGDLGGSHVRPGRPSSQPATQPTTHASTRRASTRPATQHAEPPPLPEGYDARSLDVAERRVALAGFRVAADLNAIFGK
jgi:hypothetical protein